VSEQLNKKKPGQKRVISVNFEHHRFNVVGFDLLVVAKSDRLLATLFQYPQAIRKVIYTTNAIESLNSVIRKATKNRKIFSHDNSAFKIIFLAIESASKKWTMPIRDWNAAMNQFMILREERLKKYF